MALFRREPAAAGSPAPTAHGGSGGVAGAASSAAAAASAVGGDAARGRVTVTVVAPGTRIKGELNGATEIQVLGELEGEIRVEAVVVVGTGGVVKGPVKGKVVRVVGQVVGNVTAAELVEVGASGSLEGDIAAPRVVISEGAFFRGNIDMKGDKNRETSRAAKSGGESPSKSAAANKAGEAGSK